MGVSDFADMRADVERKEWLRQKAESEKQAVVSVKRYLVFATMDYYPSGGWGDFVAAFDTIEDARQEALASKHADKSTHIVDVAQLKEVD